jgi:hypothetical protein
LGRYTEGGGVDVSDDSTAADAATPAKARGGGGSTPPAPVRVLDTPVTLFEVGLAAAFPPPLGVCLAQLPAVTAVVSG